MKRFWLVLLSLGLVMAFSASVFAADVKFSGSMYAAGVYLNKTTLKADTATDGPSTAFYYQRLRVRTDFVVSPGISVITRFDALERAWGATRSVPGGANDVLSGGTVAENQNVAFDWAYISWTHPFGILNVGQMEHGRWGTVWGDSSLSAARIIGLTPIGPVTLVYGWAKLTENSYTAINAATQADADRDQYYLAGIFNFKGGSAGLQFAYIRGAQVRTPVEAISYQQQILYIMPYAIAELGPVKVQAEVYYVTGKAAKFDSTVGADISLENLTAFIDAVGTFGPVYVGGTFAYVSGDDPATTDKAEGGVLTGGYDYDPCLIMFNYNDRTKWIGALAGNGATANGGPITNAWLYQGRVGVKPTDKLDIMASFTYATADKVAAAQVSKNYGYELDVTGTYKITNNLSYMLGAGYLWTGDYFKGTTATAAVANNYMVINKLTLTF